MAKIDITFHSYFSKYLYLQGVFVNFLKKNYTISEIKSDE